MITALLVGTTKASSGTARSANPKPTARWRAAAKKTMVGQPRRYRPISRREPNGPTTSIPKLTGETASQKGYGLDRLTE